MLRLPSPFAAWALAAAATVAAPAHAITTNLLGNAGFESTPATSSSGYCYLSKTPTVNVPMCAGGVSSWTASGLVVAIGSSSGGWGNPAGLGGSTGTGLGTEIIGLQGDNATLAQDVVAGVGDAYSYTLSWYDAGRSNFGANALAYDVYFGSVKVGSYSIGQGTAWSQHSLTFTAAGSGQLSLVVNTSVNPAADRTVFVDNFSLSATAVAVPEPATLALVGLAAGAAVAVRRRRG